MACDATAAPGATLKRFEPIQRLAIVNRGEAAMRCLRSVKALRADEGSDLLAVALYTEIDRDAPFVRHADVAVPLAAPKGEVAAYLDHDGLVEALRRAGADAVWPGWGFVAEDPSFVERLQAEKIRFLGPSPEAMRALGDKIAAKRIAEKAGVAVAPWSGGAVDSAEAAAEQAGRIGYPVVIKASAGGGGRGIRLVSGPEALEDAFRSARTEAEAAFGDGRLFIEKQIERGRHVEVQIAADRDGVVRALGCRDCSVQRRHQKVLEEAPPPGFGPDRIEALTAAAVRIAERVDYAGVGTVEFLVGGPEPFFLEMNPRLQVEHGLTEALTGIDLVQLQIRIARGETISRLDASVSRAPGRGAAIEARVCAEDPDAGFAPAPGRIARFDPALGPHVRVDTGVVAGSTVPPAFDSLVAKVIATGRDRDEARARLAAALTDFDLVIEGGATNKGWLLEILDHEDFRRGGVDTRWLDRYGEQRPRSRDFAAPALVAAAILTYQHRRALARLNFYADPAALRVPPAEGQQIDLTYEGESYRLQVYAIGSWRYRVHLDGRAIAATLREEDEHTARLEAGGRTLRVLHDSGEAGLRVEVEGRAHRFGSQAAGEVRAAAPAMVVAIHVEPGDRVEAGASIGLLEAMKMEVGFEAPVSGVVTEVRVRRGEQVAAGALLLVIDPSNGRADDDGDTRRLALAEERDPLEPLFRAAVGDRLGEPDLVRADRAGGDARREAARGVRDEVRRVLLGYDANPERADRLVRFLDAPLVEISQGFRTELAEIRHELVLFADVARLFVRSPAASVSAGPGPSNQARLRMYVRRIRAGGAGLAEEFLTLVRRALAHYEIASLEPSDGLERAVLRLLASPLSPERRDRLVLGVLRRVAALAGSGIELGGDADLDEALEAIAGMRGLVSDAVADAAIEARYVIFQGPEIVREADRTTGEVQRWLDAAESRPTPPPEAVLRHVADAPRGVFERVGRWLGDADPRRRAIALAAHLRRTYSPIEPVREEPGRHEGEPTLLVELPGERRVLAGTSTARDAAERAALLVRAARAECERAGVESIDAIELFATLGPEESLPEREAFGAALEARLPAGRLSVSWVGAAGSVRHWTFTADAGFADDLHEVHPEAAARIELARLSRFELERIPASENLYCFHGRSREVPADERIFVLADLRTRSPDEGREATLHAAAFEQVFFEATRSLRNLLAERDPRRRLQWNRIRVGVASALFVGPDLADRLARSLAPATRNLGLEKVVVSLRLLDRDAPERAPTATEIVISDVTGTNLSLLWRAPRTDALSPRSEYERKVALARRRRLVYPYEIVRMLTGSAGGNGGGSLPVGRFEEYDLDPDAAAPVAVRVAGRPYGENQAGIVFGVIETPTDEVPEGLRRVVVLSDPTRGMGSLAGPECDRVVAALDLAASLDIPVEWVPVSSGARIAMDSGTENLDATARVVRRIVEFTQADGVIHLIVPGVNVGAQSYWNALATMLMHTKGALVMTPGASMVLTGRAALEASGSVSAEDEQALGGFERVMGPNGEAQYFANDLRDAYRVLYEHYRFTYVVPGEDGPRAIASTDPPDRAITGDPCEGESEGFANVGEIFDDAANAGRKRPFPMRAVMRSLVDRDGGMLERWGAWVGAETAIVCDAHLGGRPVCLIGIESRNTPREGYRPGDGPDAWTGGTLFPLSSKKVARALNAASGNRPAVILANLSGFDGSPESMRKLQLEYGAEIARAVVNFRGPILFLVVSRYHGGAYVVFSRALNPGLRAAALSGSYASVIGGGAAAAVVFTREVRARAAADPRVLELRDRRRSSDEARRRYDEVLAEVTLEVQAELAREFDTVHSVERARDVGSLEEIVDPARMREHLVRQLAKEH